MENVQVISAEGLKKSYGFGNNMLEVLKGISFDVDRGEIVSIVGPSGAGKSTLLNLVGGLDTFQSGNLELFGRDISDLSVDELSEFRNEHVGFIFQLHNLLPEFTALENIMIPLLIRRMKKSNAKQKAESLLETFQLADRAHHKPTELSGGECQRIAVARAIIGEPDIILADEPTGSLDSANSNLLIDILFKLGKENNSSILIVTHDMNIASMTERTISLIDGRIV